MTIPARISGRTLVQGGTVLTMESRGTLRNADVLIEEGRILAVGAHLPAQDAQIIDAGNMIVLPGFVDAHRHCWQGSIRNIAVDTDLNGYFGGILASLAPRYRPEDVYAGTLSSDAQALDAGITTIYDWAHIMNSPAHADEAIRAHRHSGIRAVFGYGFPNISPQWFYESAQPLSREEVMRVRATHFPGDGGLVTMGMALRGPEHMSTFEVTRHDWMLARELGLPISVHVGTGPGGVKYEAVRQLHDAGLLFEGTNYVHCVTLSDQDRQWIRDSGGYCISTPAVEMVMDFGMPAINKTLAVGMRPGLGVDVVTTVGGDLFTQMRAAHQVGRMHAFQEQGQGYAPVTAADVLRFATIDGARAIGLGDSTGSIKEGKYADLLLLRTDRLALSPLNDPTGAIVAAASIADVDTVIVHGVVRKRGGVLTCLDQDTIARNAAVSGEYLAGQLIPSWFERDGTRS